MTEAPIEIDRLWPHEYQPDWVLLGTSSAETDFGEAAFELLKEAGVLALLAASIAPRDGHERNHAILCGLMLKIAKLAPALLFITQELGADRQLAVTRELLEACGALHYLANDTGSGTRFDQYVADSLIAERESLKLIEANVANRGEEWAIEERMARSILRTSEQAEISDLAALPSRKKTGWPSAESLVTGLDSSAYPAYRAGSSVLHSGWSDLLRNHLTVQPGGRFGPNHDPVLPRPQPLGLATLLISRCIREFQGAVLPAATEVFAEHLRSLEERASQVMQLHESMLTRDSAAAD